MTPSSCTAAVAGERRDRALVREFLSHLERVRAQQWRSLDFPEQRIQSRPAVQVIAMEETGRTTAIEHLPIDAGRDPLRSRFLEAFQPMSIDAALDCDRHYVEITLSMHGSQLPGEFAPFVAGVRAWAARRLAALADGVSNHVIIVHQTPLQIDVDKQTTAGEPGRLLVVPAELPGNFETSLDQQLPAKLAKLVAASADRHVLLIERCDACWTLRQLRLELAAAVDVPDLQKLYEIWMVDATGATPYFRLVVSNPAD